VLHVPGQPTLLQGFQHVLWIDLYKFMGVQAERLNLQSESTSQDR
jgi:hypothetical protein